MTADGVIDISDVTLIYRIAAGLEPGQDPRGDVDLDGQIDISDAVNAFLVASGQRFAVSRIDPPAPAAGEAVAVTVPGLPERVAVEVVLRADGQEVIVRVRAGGAGVPGGSSVEFAFPDLAGICREGPGGGCLNVTLGIRRDGQLSNFCPLAPLLPGERDGDRDTVPDQRDLCPQHFDPSNSDLDEDGVGDLCDNCPVDVNPGQEDGNADGSGDGCEAPRVVHIGGRVIEPEPGVDARLNDPAVKHAVLVLTRDANDEIRGSLERSNIHIIEPLAHNVFMVGLGAVPCAMRICPGFADLQRFPWFFAAFPLSPEDRLEQGLNVEQPPPEPFVLAVDFHSDVSVAAAEALLRQARANIVAQGVEISLPDRSVQRVNAWQVEGNADLLRMLAQLDAVRTVSLDQTLTEFNANTRLVLGLPMAGLDGTGIRLMQVDHGWPNGDTSDPPAALAIGAHPALAGAVIVRDCATCGVNPPYPDFGQLNGCAGNPAVLGPINCDNNCEFTDHATHVGGTLLGDGTLDNGMPGMPLNAGMAPAATVYAYDTSSDESERICERHDAILNFRTSAHNQSWGNCPDCAKYGFYNFLGRAYDQDIRLFPSATEVFAAGNYQDTRITLATPIGCQQVIGPVLPACALPAAYTAPACTPVPPPVLPPPAIAQPAVGVRERFYTVIGPGATAKSVLAVGATDETPGHHRMQVKSSWGPTLDGRIKPELVAPAHRIQSTCVPPADADCDVVDQYGTKNGTSTAAPVVTGIIALLHQRWGQIFGVGQQPPADTMRALLAHTATDLGVHTGAGGAFMVQAGNNWPAFGAADGPDFVTGYGLVNPIAAVAKLNAGNIGGYLAISGCPGSTFYPQIPFSSLVPLGGLGCPGVVAGTVRWRVTVPAGSARFKVTIAWNDPESPIGAAAPINDLNLVLRSPGGYVYPWRLDPACPYLQAVRQQNLPWNMPAYGDHRNTLEQVDVVNPAAGQWEIRVISTAPVVGGPQPFSLIATLE